MCHTAKSNTQQQWASLNNFLPVEEFFSICAEISNLTLVDRSFIPTHKKGGAASFQELRKRAASAVSFYNSASLAETISRIFGEPVFQTPLHDLNSCSALFYERPGDHIEWHYDHNFYSGRHFTVLLPIVNRNSDDTGLSSGMLFAKVDGAEHLVPTPPNALIAFEGAKLLHRVTPIKMGERRVVLSMTFCTSPRTTMSKAAARRMKDISFFGVRALWT